MSRIVMPDVAESAWRIAPLRSSGPMPITAGLTPVPGNAIASATDMIIGKTNVQKSASGSRRNSRSRASASSISGWWAPPRSITCALLFTQVPPRQRHEDVFERSVMRDDARRTQRVDQAAWRSLGDHLAVIDDRHPVTERLGLVH